MRSKDTVDICDGNSGDDFVDSEPSQAVAVNKKTIAKTPTKQNEVRGKTANLRKCPMVVFADNSSKARARQRSKLRKEASDVHNWETITERQQQEKLLEAKSEPNDDGEVVVLCDESEWSEQSGEKSQDVSADELDAADDGVIRNEQGFVIESKRQAKQECRTPYTTSEIARFHDIDSELKKCTTANAANPNLGADNDAVCTELAERMAVIYDNASHSAQETKRQIDENELAFKNEIDEYALASKNKMQREMDKMQREIDETALVFKKKFEEYALASKNNVTGMAVNVYHAVEAGKKLVAHVLHNATHLTTRISEHTAHFQSIGEKVECVKAAKRYTRDSSTLCQDLMQELIDDTKFQSFREGERHGMRIGHEEIRLRESQRPSLPVTQAVALSSTSQTSQPSANVDIGCLETRMKEMLETRVKEIVNQQLAMMQVPSNNGQVVQNLSSTDHVQSAPPFTDAADSSRNPNSPLVDMVETEKSSDQGNIVQRLSSSDSGAHENRGQESNYQVSAVSKLQQAKSVDQVSSPLSLIRFKNMRGSRN